MGRGSGAEIIQTARNDGHEFLLRRFCRAPEQSPWACASGWQMGTKVQARSGHGIACRRREFLGECVDEMDAVTASGRPVWRQANSERSRASRNVSPAEADR